MIATRRLQRNFADGFIAEAVEDLWERSVDSLRKPPMFLNGRLTKMRWWPWRAPERCSSRLLEERQM